VAFIPFPTALLGTQGNHTLPVAIYALVQSGVGVFGALSWLYAMRAGLTRPDMSPAVARVGLARAASGPLVFLASLPLALVNPYLAQGCWLLIFPAQLLIQRLAGAAG